ncbi:MAG: HAD family hydrolase [Desulfocurvibacter africanus]
MKRLICTPCMVSIVTACVVLLHSVGALAGDPLPSWNDGPTKQAVLNFITAATTEGGPGFVPQEERIAVFDNDGTLWPEQPLAQVQFALARVRDMAERDPSLKERQPFKAALAGDLAYFAHDTGHAKAMELLAATHANMTQEAFEAEVRRFFATARHPTLNAPYTTLAYAPMVELLVHLRAHGFQTWICSGGGIDFIRAVSQRMYGIPPEQVIGSSLEEKFTEKSGKWVLWREPKIGFVNDKGDKPVGIDLHIGRRPVFAAGNVRSGGDVAMLVYSQGRNGPSFQLLVNHDDAAREFAYAEKDNASLKAAKRNGWTVASIKNDWKEIFGLPIRETILGAKP